MTANPVTAEYAAFITDKTIEYLSVPCVVGFEGFFLNYLDEDFRALGLEILKQPQLLEVRGKQPESALITGHIDRHGLISLGGGEYAYAAQYMREIKYGEVNNTSRQVLEAIADRFDGERVFAFSPETAQKIGDGTIKSCGHCMKDGDSIFFIDDLKPLKQGTPLAYARTARVEDGLLKGQIDNALSLAVIYALFKDGFEGTAMLTTEEEIGKSWIHIRDSLEHNGIETKELLVLDTSPYVDHDPLQEGSIVLRNRDKSAKFNAELVARLKKRCGQLNIPYEVKDEVMIAEGKTTDELGSTELGRLIEQTEGRWSGATIQIPTNMYHTSKEMTSLRAIDNYYRFLRNILIERPQSFTNKRHTP